MSDADLRKSILATIAYYDVMDYPLTGFEVWKYLTRIQGGLTGISHKYSLVEVLKEADGDSLKRLIEERQGFYFLKGRQQLAEQRLEKNKIANCKLRKLLKVVKWLRCVPFVRMIAVTGSLGMKNTDPKSDLDLLIVLKHGRIFTGRLLVTLATHVLGQRRHGEKIANRVCLNYFVTDESLSISLKDIFSASEYSFMLPVFGWHKFQKFQKANGWIADYKPDFQPDTIYNSKFLYDTFFSRTVRGFGENLLNFSFLEQELKRRQLLKIESNPKTHQPQSLIIANDEMLVFLPEPQGPMIFEKFKYGLEKISR